MISRRNKILFGIATFAALLLFMLVWPSLERVNTASHAALCQHNLKMLVNAKDQWASDQNKTGDDIPTWPDLVRTNVGYLKAPFECPDHGNISIGRVGEAPKCSVPGHNL